ncbi:SDR family oxidoreductase [Ferrovibrio sp.]|uniref:SDR family oxidoreductase n=1 Tax=Ferrovibrio sp. TaxID=1917215 RepID=UPI001B60EE8E|nr:NAD(P)H-binding protein [Ferrovibrio sp.]MBP7064286.1 NAD(P)H-binding protein [Ferrovibrio sp.]
MTDAVTERRVTLLGASSRLGRPLLRHLQANGWQVIAAARSPHKLDAAWQAEARPFRLEDMPSLQAALADAGAVVSCLEVQHAPQVLSALPLGHGGRVVMIGSTRMFTRFPDALAARLRAGADAFLHSGKPGLLLLPTMIYGAEDDLNTRRIAAFIRRFGVIPLPAGGRSLVQPVHVADVCACIEAALLRPEIGGESIVVAGPQAVRYHDFVRCIGAAIGRRPLVLPVPLGLMLALAALTRRLSFLPSVQHDEILRLCEDKAFPIEAMRQKLGVAPMPLAEGLRRSFPQA